MRTSLMLCMFATIVLAIFTKQGKFFYLARYSGFFHYKVRTTDPDLKSNWLLMQMDCSVEGHEVLFIVCFCILHRCRVIHWFKVSGDDVILLTNYKDVILKWWIELLTKSRTNVTISRPTRSCSRIRYRCGEIRQNKKHKKKLSGIPKSIRIGSATKIESIITIDIWK